MLITSTEQLVRFCDSLAGSEFVTVDTEFMRERTYWPRLCLVQLGGPHEAGAVDPLAQGIDLTPLYALLADPKILKVFHAARQDIEIFVNATGQVPAPLFDTQVAAMVCGFGEAASYETLAARLAKAKIDKSSRFTDWCRRPLTDRQIDYALGDVTHLRDIYKNLQAQLEKSGRAEWMREEMAVLTNLATYQVDPFEIWKRLRMRGEKPAAQALLRELAAWREREAQRLDLPRGRVMKDEALMEIAHHAPSSAAELSHTRGLSQGYADSRQGKEILEIVARVKASPLPAMIGERGPKKLKVPTALYDMLKVVLKHVSEEQGVASKLIATSDDLERLAAEDEPDIPALHGWRRELFGEIVLALKRGEIALAVQGKKVVMVRKGARE